MGGGGKGGTSTSTVSIPPEVLARYNAVNAQANQLAGIDPNTGQPNTPFQPYGGEFVAPMNTVQQQGVSQTQQYAGAAQPYYQAAAGLTGQAVQQAQPLTAAQIQQYQSPYVQSVVDPTLAALRQQQGIDLASQQGQAIRAGAFGGERAGLQRAFTQGQQQLAQAQAISPLYQQAYQNALATAAQQQGLGVQTGLQAGQQIAGIGTGAQQAGLQGAQAVIGAGTLGQQTQQALDTAKYQQFLQERGYPFQLTQFLANIAEGTGALSGSTTTTTQPTSFFSDKRLKENIKKIGKTNDGLPIYSFKYKGDDRTQIGLMAQDVEKKRPEAVGLAGGYKTVDYAKATSGARHARAAGGLIPRDLSDALLALEFAPLSQGGAVFEPGAYNRGGFAAGGMPIDDILAQQARMYGASNDQGGLSQSGVVMPYVSKQKAGLGIPNVSRDPYRRLLTGSPPPAQQQYGFRQAMGDISSAGTAAETVSKGWDKLTGTKPNPNQNTQSNTQPTQQSSPPAASPPAASSDDSSLWDKFTGLFKAEGGGVMPRHYYGNGGLINPYSTPTSESMIPEDVMEDSESTKEKAEGQAVKPDGSRGGGGSGGGLGSALGAASAAINVGKGIGSFMSWLPTLFAKNGGAIYGHYANGGIVPRQAFGGNDPGGAVVDASDGGGSDKPQTTADVIRPSPKDLYSHLVNQGANPNTALMLTSAAASESAFDPTARHDKDPNTGQWTGYGMFGHRKDRLDAMRQFAGTDTPDWKQQANFALLETQDPRYQSILANAKTPQDIARAHMHFERPMGYTSDNPEAGHNYAGRLMDVQTLMPLMSGQDVNWPTKGAQQQYPGQQTIQGGIGAARDLAARLVPSDYQGRDVVKDPKTGEERPRTWGDFLTSRDFILPLMAGLGTMASSPSRYLGAAILQGLGGAASAYQGVQKGQMERDTALAQQIAGLRDLGPLVTQVNKGDIQTTPITEKLSPEAKAGMPGVVAPGGGIVGQFKTQPITVDPSNDRYIYNVSPTGDTLKNTARLLGVTNFNPITVKTALQLGNKSQADANEAQTVDQRIAASNPAQIAETRAILNKSLTSLTSLPPDPKNPYSAQTNAAAQLYNWLGAKVGLEPVNEKEISAQALLDKFAALQPGVFGPGGGSHAGYIVQNIQNAIPSARTPDEALRKIFSSVMSSNTSRGDFNRYAPEYRSATGGMSYNLMNSFDRDMGQKLLIEQKAMEDAMKPRYPKDPAGNPVLDANGQPVRQDSPLEILLKNPSDPRIAKEFDKLYGQPGLARHFLGG